MNDANQPEGGEAQRGERFMALYSSHQRRLYLYTVTLMCGAADAEDVFQEANLVLWQKFSQYQEGTNFFAWACQIIRHKAMKHREKRARGPNCSTPTCSTGWPSWPSKKSSTSTSSIAKSSPTA